jgi:beta-glucosidase
VVRRGKQTTAVRVRPRPPYTTYAYSGLTASAEGGQVKVSFTVRNTGKRAGAEVAQVYVSLPPSTGEPPKRLVAWDKVQLGPGESKTVTLAVPPLHLAVFNADKDDWEVVPGDYRFLVGGSSRETPLSATVKTGGQPVN